MEKFSLEIETYYTPDGGQLENVFNLKVLIYSQDDDGDDEFDHDGAQLENVLRWWYVLDEECGIFENGQGSDLSGRVTDLIDVVKDQQQNYVPEVIVIIINFFV